MGTGTGMPRLHRSHSVIAARRVWGQMLQRLPVLRDLECQESPDYTAILALCAHSQAFRYGIWRRWKSGHSRTHRPSGTESDGVGESGHSRPKRQPCRKTSSTSCAKTESAQWQEVKFLRSHECESIAGIPGLSTKLGHAHTGALFCRPCAPLKCFTLFSRLLHSTPLIRTSHRIRNAPLPT